MAEAQAAAGTIVQCIGAVIDVEFTRENLPRVYDALKLDVEDSQLTLEVQQQLGDGVVRTIDYIAFNFDTTFCAARR